MHKPFFLLNLIVFITFQIANQQDCEIVSIEKDEILVTNKQYQIIQTDVNDWKIIKNDEYQLTQLEMIIPYQSQDLIISTLIIEMKTPKLFGKYFCLLKRQQVHFIFCINISQQFASFKLNEKIQNNQSKIQIKVETINDEICEEIVQDQEEILIFCITINQLKIYSVNFENTKTLIIYPINELQQQNCKRKYIKRWEAKYLIIYYQCVQWEVLNFQRNQISVILNSIIAFEKFGNNIDYIENILTCNNYQVSKFKQDFCYLISNNGYYNYFIYSNNSISLNYFLPIQDLKDILINERCFVIFLVNQEKSTSKMNIISNNKIIEFESNQFKSYYSKNLLFVVSQDKIEIVSISGHKQQYQIALSELNIHSLHNLFCLIDKINNQILIYKLLVNQQIIKPSKKFILLFGQSLSNYPEKCYQIEILTFTSISQINISKLNNICQTSDKILVKKQLQLLPNEYYFKINNDSQQEMISSIFDQFSFRLLCKFINEQNLIQEQLIILNYNSIQNIILFKSKNLIFFQNCNNGQKYKFSIHQKQVFFYQENILMLDESSKKQITIIQYQFNQINQKNIELNEQIKNIVQFQQFCLIQTEENSKYILIDIQFLKIQELSEAVNNFLKQTLSYMDYRENIKDQVFFYYSGPINLFQYFEHLIIMKHEKYIYSKLESVEIIQTQEIVSNVYQLIALHQIEDIIQIYYLNVEELILLYEYNVAMAKILRPFKYSINQNYLIIAANIQEKQFLLTFAIFKNKNLKLIKTIEISSLKFLLENNYLYYFDKSNNFRVYNIEYFEVTLKNLIPKQKDFLHIQQFSFEIFLVDSNESYMKISFFLMKSNQCYQLFPIQNQIQLQLNNRNFLRIKLDELFLGQIYNLTSLQNNNTYLNGPFLLQEKISNYKQHYTIKIRTIYLQQTNNLSELQKKTKIYLIHLESGIEVVKNYEEIKKYFQIEYGMFLDMFCENEYFLQVLFLTNQNDLQVIKFLIKDNYLILDEQQLVIQQNINLNFYNQVLKIGKLIALNSDSNPYLYYLTEQTIKSLENQKEFEKIIFIKNANDLYLTTQNYFQEQYWQIQILVLKTQKLEIFLQRLIDIDLIFQELKKYILIEDIIDQEVTEQIDLLDAYLFENQIKLVLMIKMLNFQIISSFKFNLIDENIVFSVNKIVRISITNKEILQTYYYNSNILILKSTQNQAYIYDLRQQRILCDFISFISQINFQIYSLNTTHYLFYYFEIDEFFVGEVDYELEITNITNVTRKKLSTTIISQNLVSDAQVELQIIIIQDSEFHGIYLIILFLISIILIFLCLKVINQKFKQQYQQNQIEFELSNQK